jgi:hypothetical protein
MEEVRSCLKNMMDQISIMIEKASLRTVRDTEEALFVVKKGEFDFCL